ncbi:hypothetical protein P873_11530 [Arenimonas composti TR7-09 = DSM 18010]|uniref:HD Cas3-type domain-containing protein n=1 Tax=Arenimonas composti TR7-09 = DSM 18010 TaxID=1121013 RepID=A0A091BY44_9GAMM|nr:hypothetical protein P873_11530 [Arenimonas composti TR7-09 = DSM 18010]
MLRRLACWLGIDADAALKLLTFALAVHDIGKFSEAFQSRQPEIVRRCFAEPLPQRLDDGLRHDGIGRLFFAWLVSEGRLPGELKGADVDVLAVILGASFGHHGKPAADPGTGALHTQLNDRMSHRSREAAFEFFGWCASTFAFGRLPVGHDEGANLASWWIAGLAVLADWIGSNTTWFPYATEDMRQLPLDHYWQEHALVRARKALTETGVLRVPPKPYLDVVTLLPRLSAFPLRPAQVLASEIALPPEPQILVLEDATGSGKTEAALILAARLIDAGCADGMFIGLPTQATADQIYERVLADIPGWFHDPSIVSFVLAHSARDQTLGLLRRLAAVDDQLRDEADTATLGMTEWLAQGNKRALLAQIGVGTIDQILMSALRVKHQSLRLLGLFGKVLLVDEVHSFDPYLRKLLLTTVELHAAAGGSTILLSATLPCDLRVQFLRTHARGVERGLRCSRPASARVRRPVDSGEGPRVESTSYPLLTQWAPSMQRSVAEFAFPAAAHSVRSIPVDYVARLEEVLARISLWHERGDAVVWVRNTVGDAIAAWSLLAQCFGDAACTLFHSRFAAVDRRRIQDGVLRGLGRDSDAGMRRGRIVVATQVLQESLDIDADQMVCDLCPADVLLQRMGRWRRHPRDDSGNRLPAGAAADGRAPSAVVVFGPDRDAVPDSAWYSRFSRGGAHVYAAHGVVHRTALAIGNRIDLPAQFRTLVETVYAKDGPELPECLRTAEDRALGTASAQSAHADNNAIDLGKGYGGDRWTADERIGTRLGDSIEAVLLRVTESGLEPWACGRCDPDEDVWELSAIRVPGFWLASSESPPVIGDARIAALVESLTQARPALRHRLVIPLSTGEGGAATCEFAGSSRLRLSYCDRRGLFRSPG